MGSKATKGCPFCGAPASEMTDAEWCLEDGEVPGIECPQCFAGAVLETWNGKRACEYEPHNDDVEAVAA